MKVAEGKRADLCSGEAYQLAISLPQAQWGSKTGKSPPTGRITAHLTGKHLAARFHPPHPVNGHRPQTGQ